MAKDLFSAQAATYAAYRPTYPQELFAYILSFVPARDRALDCATGNGQAAVSLAAYFKHVSAIDSSEAQLKAATPKDNIDYILSSAEQTPFEENTFDLVTVAQAYHWLDGRAFATEMKRICKAEAVVAIWMYNRPQTTSKEINDLLDYFYSTIIGSYWEPERKMVDEEYKTIHFPFRELPTKEFWIKATWKKDALLGYLDSWSAVRKYKQVHGTSPFPLIQKELAILWQEDSAKEVLFPVHLRLGSV